MSDFSVRHETADTRGRYVIDHDDGKTSALTYSILPKQAVIADHTAVAAGFERHGVALQLLQALLADAQTGGFHIVPLRPFVNAQRRKHPEWAALFRG